MFVIGIIFIFFGFYMVALPAVLWDLTESWKSKDTREPSSYYIWSSRIIGIFLMLIGIVGIVEIFI
jgi:hypothetical protein